MTKPEQHSESFVIRVWLERREKEGARPQWRGVIEHVGSREQKYFRDLDAIVLFMSAHLARWGVKPSSWVIAREKLRQIPLPKYLRNLWG